MQHVFEEPLDKDEVAASWVIETGSRAETASPDVGLPNKARTARSQERPPGCVWSSKPMGISSAIGEGFSASFASSEKLRHRTKRRSARPGEAPVNDKPAASAAVHPSEPDPRNAAG